MGSLTHWRVCTESQSSVIPRSHLLSRAVVLLATVALPITGCTENPRRIDIWPLGETPFSSVQPVPGEAMPRAAGSPRDVQLAGAINETLSFRYAVRPLGSAITRAGLRVVPFTSPRARIDRSVVQIYRMRPVAIDRFPGWHLRFIPANQRVTHPLDVLVPIGAPIGGLESTLLPNETHVFWVDVTIPKGTVDGTYAGQIELTSNGETIAALPIELTVWPFILPDEGDVAAIAEIDHRSLLEHHPKADTGGASIESGDGRAAPAPDGSDELLRSTLRLLQTHRLTPVLPELTPLARIGAHGEVVIDWTHYDSIVAPCLDGSAFSNRIPLSHWPMPLSGFFSPPRSGGAIRPPSYGTIQRRYLTLCAQHFAENGWLARGYAMAPSTRPLMPQVAPRVSEFASTVDAVDARITTVSGLWPQDMAPYGWVDYPHTDFGDAVDVWMPPAQFYDVQAMAAERAAGRRTWLAIDRPPFSGTTGVQARSVDARVLSWQAAQLGSEAYHIGYVNPWPDGQENPTPDRCAKHDPNTLLYPGGPFGLDKPVASVRLKYLRQSQQDAAYRILLSEHGLGHVPDTLGESLIGCAGSDAYRTHFADGRRPAWADEPTMYDLARDIMAGELLHTLDNRRASHPATSARTTNWRRFMLGTRRLQVDVDGVRFRLTGPRTGWKGHVDCTLTIANRRRVPVSGTIRLTELAANWEPMLEEQEVPTIPPDTSRRLTLTANATSIPTSRTGHVPLAIEFTSQKGRVHEQTAHLACIVARPLDRSIRIDGDLSDWPPAGGNVAAGFQPIAGSGDRSSDDMSTKAKRRTMAFVMRDGSALYLAINCVYDETAVASEMRRNIVEYDDMIPVGEELVEILLDPLNSGTRSPTDLYHIVVKPSGTYLTEKGIAFNPPCGQRQPWSAEVEIGTRTHRGRWTAEIRIPFAAFGDVPTEHTIWGLNVTRFEASHQVFSTWSGASGNAYDPLSLGNLYLP